MVHDLCVMRTQLRSVAQRVGISRRDVWTIRKWWAPRVAAVRHGSRMVSGRCITWTAPNRTEFLRIDVPHPGRGEITVETMYTAISPGTERAQFLQLPNTNVSHPFQPGYSGVARVVEVGPDVDNLQVGDIVATNALRHQSVGTIMSTATAIVPDGVPLEVAALCELAVIGSAGVDRAGSVERAQVAVIGAGVIGVMAGLIASLRGASSCTIIARTQTHESTTAGLAFLTVDQPEVAALDASVVIDAVGTEDSLTTAIEAAADGATIVMLGSPRSQMLPLHVESMRTKGISITGAHISGLGRPWIEAVSEFLDGQRSGGIDAAIARERHREPARRGRCISRTCDIEPPWHDPLRLDYGAAGHRPGDGSHLGGAGGACPRPVLRRRTSPSPTRCDRAVDPRPVR